MKNGDLEYCIEQIRTFLNNKRPIDVFNNFDFHKLRYSTNDKYNGFKALSYDEDAQPLTKFIYMIIYNKNIPCLDSSYDIGFPYNEQNYCGETMFKMKNHNNLRYNIGNFMLLPGNTYKTENNGYVSFNTYKNSCFKDDFNEFLKKLNEIYKKLEDINFNYDDFDLNDEKHPYWNELVKNNKKFFDEIKSFNKFLEINMCKGYNEFYNNNPEDFIKKRAKLICEVIEKEINKPQIK